MWIFFIALSLGLLPGCMTLKEAGQAYFRDAGKHAGVLSPEQVLRRVQDHEQIRHILYQDLKPAKIIQCSFLRNQIYVASLQNIGGQDGKDLKYASELLEKAYQQDDQSFLRACDQVLSLRVGQIFGAIQQAYFQQLY